MPYADVNGQKLYYEDTGGAGPAVIFSHGLLMDQTMFAPRRFATAIDASAGMNVDTGEPPAMRCPRSPIMIPQTISPRF